MKDGRNVQWGGKKRKFCRTETEQQNLARVINVGNTLFLWISILSLTTRSSDLIQGLEESNLRERWRENRRKKDRGSREGQTIFAFEVVNPQRLSFGMIL